jgi:NTE family protein
MTTRALVLGGGGVVGIAWEIGVLAGLARKGVDLRDADLVAGTSAGAVVGAQLASGLDPEHLYGRQLEPPAGERPPKTSPFGLFRLVWALSRSKSAEEFGARMGRTALAATTAPEAERRAEIASWLGEVRAWPRTRLLIRAVDARSGERTDFDAASGAGLVDAVAASTAGPGTRPPATIGGRRYIDGGMHSPAAVDLAADHDRIVVIAPVVRGGGVMTGVREQIAALHDGRRVTLVTPDPKTFARITGRSMSAMLDPGRRAAAARHGLAAGLAAAPAVEEVWKG